MKKKYQVFISSTYTDLIEERIAVVQCLLDDDTKSQIDDYLAAELINLNLSKGN